jgi:hypothetical protein
VNTSVILREGSEKTYKIALATPPTFDVFVNISYISQSKQTPVLQIEPTVLFFESGKSLQWKSITIRALHSPTYLGNNELLVFHDLNSLDPSYDNIGRFGSEATHLTIYLKDVDNVGVCLSSCVVSSQFDFIFRGAEKYVETPYETFDGSVSGHA